MSEWIANFDAVLGLWGWVPLCLLLLQVSYCEVRGQRDFWRSLRRAWRPEPKVPMADFDYRELHSVIDIAGVPTTIRAERCRWTGKPIGKFEVLPPQPPPAVAVPLLLPADGKAIIRGRPAPPQSSSASEAALPPPLPSAR